MTKICKNCGQRKDEHPHYWKQCKKFEPVNSAKELSKLLKKDLEQLEKTKKGCGNPLEGEGVGVLCGDESYSIGIQLCRKCKPQNHSQQDFYCSDCLKFDKEPHNHSQHAASDILGGSSGKKHEDTPEDNSIDESLSVDIKQSSGTFNLSEKIFRFERGNTRHGKLKKKLVPNSASGRIYVKDVKEFINKRNWLDMKLKTKQITWDEYLERRTKLAGDDLK